VSSVFLHVQLEVLLVLLSFDDDGVVVEVVELLRHVEVVLAQAEEGWLELVDGFEWVKRQSRDEVDIPIPSKIKGKKGYRMSSQYLAARTTEMNSRGPQLKGSICTPPFFYKIREIRLQWLFLGRSGQAKRLH